MKSTFKIANDKETGRRYKWWKVVTVTYIFGPPRALPTLCLLLTNKYILYTYIIYDIIIKRPYVIFNILDFISS